MVTGDTCPGETGEQGIACCINSDDRCGHGDEVADGRADDGDRLGAGVWRDSGLWGINPADRSHLAWVDLLG